MASPCSCPLSGDCMCGARLRQMFADHMPFNRVKLLRRTGDKTSDDALLSSRTSHIWTIQSFRNFCQYNANRDEETPRNNGQHVPIVDNFILCEQTYLATDKNLDLHLAISHSHNDLTVVILINSSQKRSLFTRLEFAVVKGGPEEEPTTILIHDMVCETGTNASRVLLMKRWVVLKPANRWLVNDAITLSITASARFLAEKPKLQGPENHENLLKDVGGLLGTGKFSDIIIKASDGVEFKAHKAILRSRSEYFESMFHHKNILETQQNLIEITDFNGHIVREMLRYLYTDEVQLDDCALELLALSDKYNMKKLHRKCEKVLARDLKPDNALDVLRIAEIYNAKNLATKTRRFIFKNSRQVASDDKTELGNMLKALDSKTLGELFSGIADRSKKKSMFASKKKHASTAELVANFNMLEHIRNASVDQGRCVDSLCGGPTWQARLTGRSLRMEDVRMHMQRWWRDNA